jgi:hypothetical protein
MGMCLCASVNMTSTEENEVFSLEATNNLKARDWNISWIRWTRFTYPHTVSFISVCIPRCHANLVTRLQPIVGPWHSFSFLLLYIVSVTPWTGDQPTNRKVATYIQTCMPGVQLEPSIAVSERPAALFWYSDQKHLLISQDPSAFHLPWPDQQSNVC